MRYLHLLKRQMRKAKIVPATWTEHELSLFVEVEALLHLVETLACDVKAQDAWMLVSGYIVEGINNAPEQRRICLQLRTHLRYVKTASAWHNWLAWYKEQPLQVRLYTFSQDNRLERVGGCVLMGDRLEAYQALLPIQEQTPLVSSHEEFASAGQEYTFAVDGVVQKLTILSEFQQYAALEPTGRSIASRMTRDALVVNLDTLLQTAAEIDALELERGIGKRGHWKKRLERLVFSQLTVTGTFQLSQTISLDGLYHLAGALGVGKSTIIWVLTYHLARYEARHITVVMNTVVESISFAVWLRQLGIQAAPALGRNRADHALKYGLANQTNLSVERVFHPETPPDPALSWFPTPCALSGMLPAPIPVGQEPCYRLEDAEGNRYACPLMPVCPVHKVGRDLAEAQVWVLNPMSFLYSSAPKSIGNGRLSLFEAVYHISDLVIIDEADRIQVQWDRAFSPSQPIAGSYEALLDTLRRKIAAVTTEQGRRVTRTIAFNRLSKMDNQADILVNRAFLLLGRSRKLRKWLMRRQVTNARLFYLLTEDLLKHVPARTGDEEKQRLKEQLEDAFKLFWQQPMRDKGSDLALWVKNLLGSDARDHELWRTLERWLAEKMKWKLPLRNKRRHFARRLELAVVLAAMMKQINDVFHQLKGIEDQIGSLDTGTVELREALVALVPDSPIGEMLGIRLLDADASNRSGVFTAIRHRGVGRWLLHNLDRAYIDTEQLPGPHVLLTSATSWLPYSAQFHLARPPDAVLMAQGQVRPQSTVHMEFRPVILDGQRIKVSGAGQYRDQNLRYIVRQLAVSDLQEELDHWQTRDEARKVLLVVNSYDQARTVQEELQQTPVWRDRAMRLIPDDAADNKDVTIRARQVEHLYQHSTIDVLIVPLMAIQRGFNILNEADRALLGTAFFLVRPYPPPDDLGPQILSLNSWWMQQLSHYSRQLKSGTDLRKLRQTALKAWNRRLRSVSRGVNRLDNDLYREFLRDQFIPIWQTIGRLIRGGRNARVFFIDAAYGSSEGQRHMLRDWYQMLESLMLKGSDADKFLAQALYENAYLAFKAAIENGRIF